MTRFRFISTDEIHIEEVTAVDGELISSEESAEGFENVVEFPDDETAEKFLTELYGIEFDGLDAYRDKETG
jgi:hypothetical protein